MLGLASRFRVQISIMDSVPVRSGLWLGPGEGGTPQNVWQGKCVVTLNYYEPFLT